MAAADCGHADCLEVLLEELMVGAHVNQVGLLSSSLVTEPLLLFETGPPSASEPTSHLMSRCPPCRMLLLLHTARCCRSFTQISLISFFPSSFAAPSSAPFFMLLSLSVVACGQQHPTKPDSDVFSGLLIHLIEFDDDDDEDVCFKVVLDHNGGRRSTSALDLAEGIAKWQVGQDVTVRAQVPPAAAPPLLLLSSVSPLHYCCAAHRMQQGRRRSEAVVVARASHQPYHHPTRPSFCGGTAGRRASAGGWAFPPIAAENSRAD